MSGPAAPTRPSLAAELLLACWLALAAGLLEWALLLVKRYGLGTLVLVNPHVVWMAPIVYAVLFAPVTLLLRLPARRLPGIFTLRTTTWVLAFLGTYSALQVVRVELWRLAIVLLSLGIATRTSRLAAHPEALLRLARRSAPVLLAIVLLAEGGRAAGLALSERGALAALPAAPSRAPNVLLLIYDTVRALNLSSYGYYRQTTPRLDSLAREGVLFERAVATTSWTGPSHASLFTGHFPDRLGSIAPTALSLKSCETAAG
jgi:glucan phosphoethanolaminetransferase (alkaline phosphatase superfamily)